MVLRLIAVELLVVSQILASKLSWAQDQMLAGRETEKHFVPSIPVFSKDRCLSDGTQISSIFTSG
jgi:hypothetical protein